ncbi:MAG: hypothetical protein ACPIDX_07245, partial [Candidatus Puniceispirillaceae bacterium]
AAMHKADLTATTAISFPVLSRKTARWTIIISAYIFNRFKNRANLIAKCSKPIACVSLSLRN